MQDREHWVLTSSPRCASRAPSTRPPVPDARTRHACSPVPLSLSTPAPTVGTTGPGFCEERTSILAASFWMFSISLALFFLPVFGSFIGGFIGGCKLGVVRKALLAALIPTFFAAGALWFVLAAFDLPTVGFIAAAGLGFVFALSNLGVATGATLGALANPETNLPRARLERT